MSRAGWALGLALVVLTFIAVEGGGPDAALSTRAVPVASAPIRALDGSASQVWMPPGKPGMILLWLPG